MKYRFQLSLATLVVGSVYARPALAGDAAFAEVLFREGRALMDKGDLAAACPKLGESYAQDPATGTLLALALCQEMAGQTSSAWANFTEAATRAKREGNAAREAAAKEHQSALEPKLSRLTIEVDPAAAAIPGLVVTRDGTPVGQGAWGVAGPLDPGEHSIVATAPGREPWKVVVRIGVAADSQIARVPAFGDEPSSNTAASAAPYAPPPASSPGTPAPAVSEGAPVPSPAADSEATSGPPLREIGLVVGGLGIVGLGVSGYFALHAKSLNDESNAAGHCTGGCDDVGYSKRQDAISASTGATISLLAGSVLTAAGVTLFFVGGPKDAASASVEAAPAVGLGHTGFSVRGRF